MPFTVLVIAACLSGVVAYLVATMYPSSPVEAPPTVAAGRQLETEVIRHPWLARLLAQRLDPRRATGLALTIALGIAIVGGLAVGVLAYLMR